jgi:RNA polymerase sigma factor (sigma-70 family)
VAERDEPAFAELVRRHGPMVLGVCQRITRQQQDAEDAFQATFLILARKAGRVARPEVLANWLYGVAYRVARKARRTAARRRAREGQVAVMPDTGVLPAESTSDLAAFLDAELAALPERFRAAIVLCDLYELSHAAAAERLGIPKGTLSNRLSAGRKKLAARLARRGITLPAVGLGVALGGVTPTLAARTVTLALGGVASAAVQQLTLSGGTSMKAIGWTAAACAAIGLAAGVVSALPGDEPAKPAPAAKVEVKVPDKGTVASRPHMLRRVELRNAVAANLTWSHDGKLLALGIADESAMQQYIRVYDTAALTPLAIVQTKSWRVIGFYRDQPVLVMYHRGEGQINVESKLEFWRIPEPGKAFASLDTPTKVTLLDPADGTPFALIPGDQSVLCVAERNVRGASDRSSQVRFTFRIIDLGTGRLVQEVLQLQCSGSLTYCVSPDGKNLFLGIFDGEKGTGRLECWATDTGKRSWKKEIAEIASGKQLPKLLQMPITVSPDGKLIAAIVPRKSPPEASDTVLSEFRLFDAATGAEGTRLEGQPTSFSNAISFSNAGRMLINGSTLSTSPHNWELAIWDTKSGKILKSWPGNANAQFSPSRPVVAILEYTHGYEGNKQISISILGLWDVSPLLKAAPAK